MEGEQHRTKTDKDERADRMKNGVESRREERARRKEGEQKEREEEGGETDLEGGAAASKTKDKKWCWKALADAENTGTKPKTETTGRMDKKGSEPR